ncbi:unnamed protein product [Camellia sinensis]
MTWELSPRVADKKIIEGEGGSYWSWSSSKFPLLSEAKVGAGKLLLHPSGFALPHYADSSKIGFVLQGRCTVGMVFPNASEEKVLAIKKGDAIQVPAGGVSWWFNGGDTDMVMVFIGETSKAYNPGEFTYFLLSGTLSVLKGFSTDFVCRAYNINKEEANELVTSQTETLIIKIEEGTTMPQPCKDNNNGSNNTVINIETALADTDVKNGGLLTKFTAKELPLLEQVGLSAKLVKLGANEMSPILYGAGSSVEVTYIVKGSGRVQIVGINGELALDTKVHGGDLFVVPRFFVVAIVAGGDGMECFSVITSSQPVFGELSGNTSIWKALSPVVLQTSLGVTPKFSQLFISKN